MKKLSIGILTVFTLLLFSPAQLKAGTDNNTVSTTVNTTAESTEASVMVVRLNEIKAMDMSTLSKTEKKELRKEVRSIKSELKAKGESTAASGGGVYISVGAAILIVLLLILLL